MKKTRLFDWTWHNLSCPSEPSATETEGSLGVLAMQPEDHHIKGQYAQLDHDHVYISYASAQLSLVCSASSRDFDGLSFSETLDLGWFGKLEQIHGENSTPTSIHHLYISTKTTIERRSLICVGTTLHTLFYDDVEGL